MLWVLRLVLHWIYKTLLIGWSFYTIYSINLWPWGVIHLLVSFSISFLRNLEGFCVVVLHLLSLVYSMIFYCLWCYCKWKCVPAQCVCCWCTKSLLIFVSWCILPWFCILPLLKLLVVSRSFLVEFLRSLMYIIISCESDYNLTFLFCVSLVSFSCLIASTSTLSTILKISGNSRQPPLVSYFNVIA